MKKLISQLRNFAKSKGLSIDEVGSFRVDPEGEHYTEEEYLALGSLPSSIEVQVTIPSLGDYSVVLYVLSEVE